LLPLNTRDSVSDECLARSLTAEGWWNATWRGSTLDDLYIGGVTRGGSDLAIAGQQRRIEHLGKRDVYRIVGSEGCT